MAAASALKRKSHWWNSYFSYKVETMHGPVFLVSHFLNLSLLPITRTRQYITTKLAITLSLPFSKLSYQKYRLLHHLHSAGFIFTHGFGLTSLGHHIFNRSLHSLQKLWKVSGPTQQNSRHPGANIYSHKMSLIWSSSRSKQTQILSNHWLL